jgi:hypothetical protein
MPSAALGAFQQAVHEINDLERADPTPIGGTPVDSAIARVVGRATIVLLSSHFERYVYAVNEEATRHLATSVTDGTQLPEAMRLLHARPALDSLFETSWDRRGSQLEEFLSTDGWLWMSISPTGLDHERLLTWMRTPTPKNLVRYYRYWGITDIFGAITRTVHTRTELWLKLDELVRKRNNIAHGDATTEATPTDLRSYTRAALRFCERADRQMARALTHLGAATPPW